MDGHKLKIARGLAAAVAVLALGVAAAPAAADDAAQTYAVGSQPMLLAQQIARTHWGYDPCQGQVAITWTTMPDTINAQSTWANPTDAYNNSTQNMDCSIQFNDAISWDWNRFCTVLVHEYGHLTGHAHSPDPADVMYAYYVAPLSDCVAAAPAPVVPTAPAQADQLSRAASVAPVLPRGNQAAGTTAAVATAHIHKVHETHRVHKRHKAHRKRHHRTRHHHTRRHAHRG